MSDTESVEVSSSGAEPLYNVGSLQKVPLASQPMIQSGNQGLAFSRDGCNPITLSSLPYHPPCGVRIGGETNAAAPGVNPGGVNVNICGSGGAEHLPVKKKGRPGKYRPDSLMLFGLIPGADVAAAASSGGFTSPPAGTYGSASGGSVALPASAKKSQGRPPGSCNKKHQLGALGSGGTGFVPHVITVKAGEDVFSRIMSSLQHGAKDVCILSGNGAISRVALRRPHIYGGTVVYEGRFEILSLSGSFVLSEAGGLQSRTGGLSVSLSGSEGQVLGGAVAGLLVAASSVQVVIGSFCADGGGDGGREEPKEADKIEPLSAPPKPETGPGGVQIGGSSPASGGSNLSES